jgi:hypothetical protein
MRSTSSITTYLRAFTTTTPTRQRTVMSALYDLQVSVQCSTPEVPNEWLGDPGCARFGDKYFGQPSADLLVGRMGRCPPSEAWQHRQRRANPPVLTPPYQSPTHPLADLPPQTQSDRTTQIVHPSSGLQIQADPIRQRRLGVRVDASVQG